jgi:hypothetical protein
LPQGCAKKIQVQLLLAHFALKLRYPSARATEVVGFSTLPRRYRLNRPRATRRAQRRSTARRIFRPPLVQKLTPDTQIPRQLLYIRRKLKPRHCRQLEFPRILSSFLRHPSPPIDSVPNFLVSV